MSASGAARHKIHTLTVEDIERLTEDAVALTFEVPDPLRPLFAFDPGQHIALLRANGRADDIRRSYSICSPAGGPLRVAVKRLPGGEFSTYVHTELSPGDSLHVLPPAGRFTTAFHPARRRHYAAIAAGSGITPILSILSSALEIEPGSQVSLIYANRTMSSIMFLEELEDLKDRHRERVQLIHVLSREQQETELTSGRIDRTKLERILSILVSPERVDEWFLCGPSALLESARATLIHAGVPSSAIHRELFHADGLPAPSTRPAIEDDAGATVEAILDGRRTTIRLSGEGLPILDALLAKRPDAPFACKGGVCGTCRCRLLEGRVRMDRTFALEDDELTAGVVLACQAHPESERVVLDFDAA